MKISTSDESNLILTIADVLKSARVSPSGLVRFSSSRETHQRVVERIGNELDDRIGDICGELGVLDFVRFSLMREILETGIRPKIGPLVKNKPYDDTLETAKRLVERIGRIPYKLRAVSPLPASFSRVLFNGITSLEIGNGVRIVSAEWLSNKLSLEAGSELLTASVLRNTQTDLLPKKDSHFFCTWHSGFPGNFTGNTSVQQHLDKVRAFHGCLLALGVLEEDSFFTSYEQHSILVTDITDDDNGPLVLTDQVDSDIAFFYENFDVSLDYYKSLEDEDEDSDNDSATSLPDLDSTELALRAKALESLKHPFNRGDHSRRIFTSCLWLFRSFVSTRPLDVILESTIALEVLLGDREAAEGLGLTKLLANRCAYLLGRSAEDRSKIMADFKSIYDIRSQIVHTGLHQMDRKANKASLSARDLAAKILRHELQL